MIFLGKFIEQPTKGIVFSINKNGYCILTKGWVLVNTFEYGESKPEINSIVYSNENGYLTQQPTKYKVGRVICNKDYPYVKVKID